MTPTKTSGVLRVAATGAAAGAVLLRIWHGGATELQGSYSELQHSELPQLQELHCSDGEQGEAASRQHALDPGPAHQHHLPHL